MTDSEVESSFCKSSSLKEFRRQYFTFHEDGKVLSGFRGVSLSHTSDAMSVFISKDSYLGSAGRHGYEAAKAMHCHIIIHEFMHLQSNRGKGALYWPYDTVTSHDCRAKLDEGLTELFARQIVYHMRGGITEDVLNSRFIPSITVQCSGANQLPTYECLKDIAVIIANDVGYQICVKAYFEGDWSPFNAKLLEFPKYRNACCGSPINKLVIPLLSMRTKKKE